MRINEDFLKPGMIVTSNVYKNEGDKIPVFLANRVLSERDIEILKRLNQRIKEENEKSPNNKMPLVTLNIRTNVDNNETIDQNTKEAIIEGLKKYDIKATLESSRILVQQVLSSRYYNYDLSKYVMKENDEYSEAVEICGFALALAKSYNSTVPQDKEVNLQNLAVATLLHNVGSMCSQNMKLLSVKDDVKNNSNKETGFLDKRMFRNYDDSLFDTYKEEYKGLYGYAILKDDISLSSITKLAILLQDENVLGEGPLRVIPNLMNMDTNQGVLASKMIAVCKVYDKVLNEVLKRGESPENIIEVMKHMAESSQIDKNLTNLFLKSVPLYSIGTRVILSNDIVAEVIEINDSFLDRPKVKVLTTGNVIDLSKINIVTVKKIADYNIEEIMISQEKLREQMSTNEEGENNKRIH